MSKYFLQHSFNTVDCFQRTSGSNIGATNVLLTPDVIQGRSQDFSKGGAKVMEAKSLEKEKLLVIRTAKEVHNLWINNWLYSPRKLGVLPTKLPSCFYDILS